MSRRVLVVALVGVLAAAAVAARVAADAATARQAGSSSVLSCGVERWTVKTLQDRPKLLRVQKTTVAHLTSLPRPASIPPTRLPSERHVYRVVAQVTLDRQEADQDLHLVLKSGTAHMIAEAPNAPTCTPNATAYRKKQMAAGTAKVTLCANAVVIGVALLGLQARPDRCGTERDRAAPRPRVPLRGSAPALGCDAGREKSKRRRLCPCGECRSGGQSG
jgi:hypothetical protein